jgi:hypothetical protein
LPVGSWLFPQITDCLALAHETKHEKVIRGIGLGMALIAYGQEEIADGLIEQVCVEMLRDYYFLNFILRAVAFHR